MKVESLRTKHPTFTYERFRTTRTSRKLEVDFFFTLEPGITFQPKVSIPVLREVEDTTINNLAFHLGLIEAVSYWKAACSPQLIVKAGQLNEQQAGWWHDLFVHGLGEFFYRNNIDFSQSDFFSIASDPDAPSYPVLGQIPLSGDLVMVGGGKDSAVTLEVLKSLPSRRNVLMLNPTKAAVSVAETAGYKDPLIIKRVIDPTLLELNREGYLNGHTPFSAYLAFLGVFVGLLHDFQYIVSSNEQSAGEGNVIFKGIEVNHQYSKSFRFEKLFRQYCDKYLQSDIQYLSFLRPLYELQIARIFADEVDKYTSFCSCNVNKGESWCGHCPKCAFVYLSLSPFLNKEKMRNIFGGDLFSEATIQKHITDLVGLGEHKPFDCVGTTEESVMAVALTIRKQELNGEPVPSFLLALKDKLKLTEEEIGDKLEAKLKSDWNDNNFLPPEYARLLREKLSNI